MALYARHGKIIAKPGQREALLALLTAGTRAADMPGCQLYIVGVSDTATDAILVTEIWDSAEAHLDSLKLETVRATIEKAMPLIDKVEGESMALAAGWPLS